MLHAFYCAVIQIHRSETQFWRTRDLVPFPSLHSESVVLRRDFYSVEVQVLHRVVSAVVPERELERRRTKGATDELMAEADAEDRNVRLC